MTASLWSIPILKYYPFIEACYLILRGLLFWFSVIFQHFSSGRWLLFCYDLHRKGAVRPTRAEWNHGVRRCLETIVLVLLPIFARNSSVYVGALGENYLQYPFFVTITLKSFICFKRQHWEEFLPARNVSAFLDVTTSVSYHTINSVLLEYKLLKWWLQNELYIFDQHWL